MWKFVNPFPYLHTAVGKSEDLSIVSLSNTYSHT